MFKHLSPWATTLADQNGQELSLVGQPWGVYPNVRGTLRSGSKQAPCFFGEDRLFAIVPAVLLDQGLDIDSADEGAQTTWVTFDRHNQVQVEEAIRLVQQACDLCNPSAATR